MPQLCPACEVSLAGAIHRAQASGTRLDFHWCEHRNVMILIGWENGRPANLSLHGGMSEGDVVRLFHLAGARQLVHVPVTRRLNDADTLN
jgi:hypothetical protein